MRTLTLVASRTLTPTPEYDREGGRPFKTGYKAWGNTDQLLVGSIKLSSVCARQLSAVLPWQSLNLAGNLIGVKGVH